MDFLRLPTREETLKFQGRAVSLVHIEFMNSISIAPLPLPKRSLELSTRVPFYPMLTPACSTYRSRVNDVIGIRRWTNLPVGSPCKPGEPGETIQIPVKYPQDQLFSSRSIPPVN